MRRHHEDSMEADDRYRRIGPAVEAHNGEVEARQEEERRRVAESQGARNEFDELAATERAAESLARFQSLPMYQVVGELEASSVKDLREIAEYLKLETSYPNGSRKSGAVMAAGIFDYLRQERRAA